MPLLDHFNPPLSRSHPWRSFHSAWAAAMARLLNDDVLPAGFYAVPNADRDGPVEIDVATLQLPVPANGARGPCAWTPPAPSVAVAVELPPLDTVEMLVFAGDGAPRLAAAVELVSPRNQDRPQSQQALAMKCVGYLQQGSSVVLVDTVTARRADWSSAILSLLGRATEPSVAPAGLAAISYRTVDGDDAGQQLQLWPAPLALGEPLPRLPLWIAIDFAVPLDLEASYHAACVDVRIRQAS